MGTRDRTSSGRDGNSLSSNAPTNEPEQSEAPGGRLIDPRVGDADDYPFE